MKKQIFLVIFITCLINNSYSVAAQAPAPTNVYLLGGFSKQELHSLREDSVNNLEKNRSTKNKLPNRYGRLFFGATIARQKENIALIDEALEKRFGIKPIKLEDIV